MKTKKRSAHAIAVDKGIKAKRKTVKGLSPSRSDKDRRKRI